MFCLLLIVSFSFISASSAAIAAEKTKKIIVIERTLETSTGYMHVNVRLYRNNEIVEGEPAAPGLLGLGGQIEDVDDIDALLDSLGVGGGKRPRKDAKADENNEKPPGATYFPAILDTGASAYVLSPATVKRFNLEVIENAVYHEVGLHGQTPMGVTGQYALALGGSDGTIATKPGKFYLCEQNARMQINKAMTEGNQTEMMMGEINIVGMPAIEQFIIEIDPSKMDGAMEVLQGKELGELDLGDLNDMKFLDNLENVGAEPSVTLYPPNHMIDRKDVDVTIKLDYRDFNREHNPDDKGPLPTMSRNPMITGIRAVLGAKEATGDFLLDTGAPISIISTRVAKELGLMDDQGNFTRDPAFSLPLGGVSGKQTTVQGFRLDRLSVPAEDGTVIEFINAHIVVTDISTTLDSGETVTLDGVFGTNLLLPSVSGLGLGLPDNVAPGPFSKIWIDGPRRELMLKKAEPPKD